MFDEGIKDPLGAPVNLPADLLNFPPQLRREDFDLNFNPFMFNHRLNVEEDFMPPQLRDQNFPNLGI